LAKQLYQVLTENQHLTKELCQQRADHLKAQALVQQQLVVAQTRNVANAEIIYRLRRQLTMTGRPLGFTPPLRDVDTASSLDSASGRSSEPVVSLNQKLCLTQAQNSKNKPKLDAQEGFDKSLDERLDVCCVAAGIHCPRGATPQEEFEVAHDRACVKNDTIWRKSQELKKEIQQATQNESGAYRITQQYERRLVWLEAADRSTPVAEKISCPVLTMSRNFIAFDMADTLDVSQLAPPQPKSVDEARNPIVVPKAVKSSVLDSPGINDRRGKEEQESGFSDSTREKLVAVGRVFRPIIFPAMPTTDAASMVISSSSDIVSSDGTGNFENEDEKLALQARAQLLASGMINDIRGRDNPLMIEKIPMGQKGARASIRPIPCARTWSQKYTSRGVKKCNIKVEPREVSQLLIHPEVTRTRRTLAAIGSKHFLDGLPEEDRDIAGLHSVIASVRVEQSPLMVMGSPLPKQYPRRIAESSIAKSESVRNCSIGRTKFSRQHQRKGRDAISVMDNDSSRLDDHTRHVVAGTSRFNDNLGIFVKGLPHQRQTCQIFLGHHQKIQVGIGHPGEGGRRCSSVHQSGRTMGGVRRHNSRSVCRICHGPLREFGQTQVDLQSSDKASPLDDMEIDESSERDVSSHASDVEFLDSRSTFASHKTTLCRHKEAKESKTMAYEVAAAEMMTDMLEERVRVSRSEAVYERYRRNPPEGAPFDGREETLDRFLTALQGLALNTQIDIIWIIRWVLTDPTWTTSRVQGILRDAHTNTASFDFPSLMVCMQAIWGDSGKVDLFLHTFDSKKLTRQCRQELQQVFQEYEIEVHCLDTMHDMRTARRWIFKRHRSRSFATLRVCATTNCCCTSACAFK